jgi:ankyrin repeat protein
MESLINWPGINLNAQNDMGETALHRAAATNHYGSIKTLVDCQGIDVTLLTSSQETPLIKMARYSEVNCNKLLELSAAVINARDRNGSSALVWAIQKRNICMLLELLRINNLDATLADNNNKTPLMYAIESGQTKVVADLLARDNSNVEAQDNAGDTALIIAARLHDDANMVQQLLDHGANIATRNIKGYNAEMSAKHTGIFRLLAQYRATTNVPVAHPQAGNMEMLVAPSDPPMEPEEIASLEQAVIRPPVNLYRLFAESNRLGENCEDKNPKLSTYGPRTDGSLQ